MQPLVGITVVTLEHAIAAPFATRQLADLGARVIKIERPAVGDFARSYDERVRGLASHFVWTNRSKESLTLDVKHPVAQQILQRLIREEADVVVQNLAPGAAAGMYAYSNILAALLQRAQTGRGQHIDISMLEALAEWMNFPLYYAMDGAPPPARTGASHATIYPYGPFRAGDGKVVMLGLQNGREWIAFCDKVLLAPALARDVRTTAGPVPALLLPGLADADHPRFDPVPALGEHTDAILRALGYSEKRIAALRADQII